MSRHLLIAVLFALAFAGCSVEGVRRTFPLEVESALPSEPNTHGFVITLDEARMNLGPITFYEGRVHVARTFSPWSLLYGTAWAHPGHYHPGEARGELLGTHEVDLLVTEPTALGDVDAVTGSYGSVELSLPALADPGGSGPEASLRLSGQAVRDEEVLPFSAVLALTEPVSAIRFERQLGEEPGAVVLRVDVGEWLRRVDFSTETEVDGDGVRHISEGSQAHNALVRDVKDPSAFTFRWEDRP